MGNFDWVNEIKPSFVDFIKQYYSTNGEYKVLIDSISMEKQLIMMDKLYDHGFSWRGGHGRYDTSRLKIPLLYLDTKSMTLAWDELPSTYADLTHNHFLDDEDKESTEIPTEIPKEDFFTALGMGVNGVNESEEIDGLEWIRDVKPRPPLKVGTCLNFKHSEEEEEWREDEYGNMVDHGKMEWYITGLGIGINQDKPTFSMVATDRMGESRQIFMEVEKVKELYDAGVYEPCKKQSHLKRVMKEEIDEWEWTKGKVYSVGQIIELGSENILKEGQIIYLTGKVFKDKSSDEIEFLDVNSVPVKVMKTNKKGRGFKVITIEGSENLRKYISSYTLYLGMVDADDDIMVTF